MRSEQEMMDLILGIAQKDARVRIVGLNGSRANPRAPKDQFQDYDIVYIVTEMDSFLKDPHWINAFGERLILQTPEDSRLFESSLGGWFSYLMLFRDGNRIDLILAPLTDLERYLKQDSQTIILLDKDHRISSLPPPSDRDYWVRSPAYDHYQACCNEFWWLVPYVAKGICRKEFLYATDHLAMVRSELLRMMAWCAGFQCGFQESMGKCYKQLKHYLPEADWNALVSTYQMDGYVPCWKALFTMQELFRSYARQAAGFAGFDYFREEEENVSGYIQDLWDQWCKTE